MKEDSIDGIYDTLMQCAMISKSAGGEIKSDFVWSFTRFCIFYI